jgi:hypothetical protein
MEGQAAAGQNADFDRWLMSLSGLLGTEAMIYIPYINVGPLADENKSVGTSFGLVWAGRPTYPQDRQDSMDAALLTPLFDVPDTQFQALQRDGGHNLGPALWFHRDWSGAMETFLEERPGRRAP